MFNVPQSTRFDLKFSLFGFPIRVHPLFWLLSILFGLNNGAVGMLIWVVVVFCSILLHELGHSFAMRMYGVRSHIVLHLMGGMAIPDDHLEARRFSDYPVRSIVVALAGPVAGFLLAGLTYLNVRVMGGLIMTTWVAGFIPYPQIAFMPWESWYVHEAIADIFWVNIFWGIFNLLPVFPLDGGRVAQGLFLLWDPLTGVRNSLWLSVIVGLSAAGFGFFYFGSIYMALLFGSLAGQSYAMLNQRG